MSASVAYADFLADKAQLGSYDGFEPVWMPDALFDFQAHLVDWAVRKGRSAIFADCGLGKTLMQLAWAERNELITRNRLRLFRFRVSKDERVESPAEYRDDDVVKILAALDPKLRTQWRPFVALAVCGAQGVRQHAVLHLKWDDVQGDTVTWQKSWDKLGRTDNPQNGPLTRKVPEHQHACGNGTAIDVSGLARLLGALLNRTRHEVWT